MVQSMAGGFKKLEFGCRVIDAGAPSLVSGWRAVMFQLSGFYCPRLRTVPQYGTLVYVEPQSKHCLHTWSPKTVLLTPFWFIFVGSRLPM